jgi:hypothetical protein
MNEPVATPPQDASAEHQAHLHHLRECTYLPDEKAPYHGMSHPDRVWEKARVLIERCAALGIPVNGDDLRNAIENHDALQFLPPHLLGCNSSEEVAALVNYHFLKGCGYTDTAVARISAIIMASHPDVRPTTPEEIIMRAADLANIGAHYAEFTEASQALHREACTKTGHEIPFRTWMHGAFLYLERFLWPMLELTPAARDEHGRSTWHTNAIRNLSTLWRASYGEGLAIVAEFFPEGAITPKMRSPSEFYIALHPDESARKASMEKLHAEAIATTGAAFAIPATRGAFPIPDETCSHVISHDASLESLRESLRVTGRGGLIVLCFTGDLDPRVIEVAKLFPCRISNTASEGDKERKLLIYKDLFR